METIPAPQNEAANTANRIIRSLVFDVALKSAKAALIVEAPWIAWPVVSQLFDFVMNALGERFYIAIAEHSTFLIIDLQTEAKRRQYDAAVEELGRVLPEGDIHAIEAAKQKFKHTLRRLVRTGGESRP
jgi:hypothetical protein